MKCIVSVICVLAVAGTLYAGISVDPTFTEVSLLPCQSEQGTYTVINTGEAPVIVTIEPIDWLRQYLQKEHTVDVSKWLFFEELEFSLEPGAIKKVPYTVTVPPSMHEEQAAQVFFAFRNTGQEQAAFRTRLGVIFYLSVRGTERIKAKIKSDTIRPEMKENGTYDIVSHITIQNKGNVHIRPRGVITLTSRREDIGQIAVKLGKGIYPHHTDTLAVRGEQITLSPGTYKATVSLDCSMYGIEKHIKKKVYFTI